MAGTKGPIGKRSEERQRRNEPDISLTKIDVARLIQADVIMPEPDEDWHPIAKRWYESLAESGQCVFYEPSDWATAYLVAESLSRDLSEQFVGISERSGEVMKEKIPIKGASLSAYGKMFNVLMVTEGDRRRLSAEITRSSHTVTTTEEQSTVSINKNRRDAVGN